MATQQLRQPLLLRGGATGPDRSGGGASDHNNLPAAFGPGAAEPSASATAPRHHHGLDATVGRSMSSVLVRVDKVEGALVAIEEELAERLGRRPHHHGMRSAGSIGALTPRAASPPPSVAPHDSFLPCVFNLSKVILGAGIMAMPKAFYLLGWVPGVTLLVAVACLAYFSLAGLVDASDALPASVPQCFASVTGALLGPRARSGLRLAVFANCWTMLVVFLVVIADILVGPAAAPGTGLLCELAGACTGLAASRGGAIAAVSALVLLPLASLRRMEALAPVNIVGTAANAAFAAVALAVAGAALRAGAAHALPAWPDWDAFAAGGGGGGTAAVALAVASIVPIVLSCDTCHQSLHPLMAVLTPYSAPRMRGVVASALLICNTLYLAVALAACAAFGAAIDDDALNNYSAAAMAPLFGSAALASATAAALRLGYLASLVGSYTLLCFPLRAVMAAALPGGAARANDAAAATLALERAWMPLTLALVASAALIAAGLPSIWGALSFIGATACTAQAFIYPALIILAAEPLRAAKAAAAASGLGAALLGGGSGGGSGSANKLASSARRAAAMLLVVIGVLMFANGFVQQALAWRTPASAPASGGGGGEPPGAAHALFAPLFAAAAAQRG